MAKRVIIGGIVGGIILFGWGAAAHMALPLGGAGLKSLPAEQPLVEAMKQNIQEPGLYMFPGMPAETADTTAQQREANMKALEEKVKAGPNGLLLYHPGGGEMMTTRQLLIQMGTDIASALIAACLLAVAAPIGYISRVFFVTLLGFIATLTVSVPYWNWYGFPMDFTMAELLENVIGFLLLGFLLAGIVKKTPSNAPSA